MQGKKKKKKEKISFVFQKILQLPIGSFKFSGIIHLSKKSDEYST